MCAVWVQAGLSVAVVDKKSRSGEKIHTTGVIVKDAIDDNPWLHSIPRELVRRVEAVRLYSPRLDYVDLHAPDYYFWATDTPALLDWMVDDVRALGVAFFHDTVFADARLHSRGALSRWHILGKRGLEECILTARYLVGADGPLSKVAKVLGLSRNTQFLFGQEYEFQNASVPVDALHCFISREFAPGYLGWALQGVGVHQIGLARRFYTDDEHSRKLDMTGFLQHISPHIQVSDAEPVAIRAGMIPCGGVLKNIAISRAILVGDAAGMVSPVTAGGIHTALKHGAQVGAEVAQFLHNDRALDPAEYLHRTYPNFALKKIFRWGYDTFQYDGLFNPLLRSRAFRRVAEQIYFYRRGVHQN